VCPPCRPISAAGTVCAENARGHARTCAFGSRSRGWLTNPVAVEPIALIRKSSRWSNARTFCSRVTSFRGIFTLDVPD
jgi:hypothetical protein